MKLASLLKNSIMEYAWGSHTAIPELLGARSPSDTPQAELWIGAHPKAPSLVFSRDRWIPLDAAIEKEPVDILGDEIHRKFGPVLPFLFKVLAAEKPLSIQAHPGAEAALKGFLNEERAGIPIASPRRNYRDRNGKPECLCALATFWALCGFRETEAIVADLGKIFPRGLAEERAALAGRSGPEGLKELYRTLMMIDPERKHRLAAEAGENIRYLRDDPAFWLTALLREYPDDIMFLSPLLFNLVRLDPGEAIFLPPGEIHSYLEGVGIELMANSDNVLRAGLTEKHVDLEELLKIASFVPKPPERIVPVVVSDCESVYPAPTDAFSLSVFTITEGKVWGTSPNGVEIVLCTEGSGCLTTPSQPKGTVFGKGDAILVPAACGRYSIHGKGCFYRAGLPTGRCRE